MTITRNFAYTIYNLIRKLFIEKYEEQDRRDAMKRRDELNGWKNNMYEEIFLFTTNPILDYGILFLIGIIILWWKG